MTAEARRSLLAPDPPELDERDVHAWTRQPARALSRLRGTADDLGLDPAHLAEEIRDLGSEVRHAVDSQLERWIEHPLKLDYSRRAEARRTWTLSIRDARRHGVVITAVAGNDANPAAVPFPARSSGVSCPNASRRSRPAARRCRGQRLRGRARVRGSSTKAHPP